MKLVKTDLKCYEGLAVYDGNPIAQV